MSNCCRCGELFDVSDARQEFYAEFGEEISYDEEYGGEVCGNCAISGAHSNINLGRAIDMVNGDEDYDPDFVLKHL